MNPPDLTPRQAQLLQQCKTLFTPLWEKRIALLEEMMKVLEIQLPESIGEAPAAYLLPFSNWFQHLEILPADRGFLSTRLGFYLGELLRSELEMEWFLVEDTDSRYFAKYVLVDPKEIIAADPITMAFQLLSKAAPRDLVRFYEQWKLNVQEIEVDMGDYLYRVPDRRLES